MRRSSLVQILNTHQFDMGKHSRIRGIIDTIQLHVVHWESRDTENIIGILVGIVQYLGIILVTDRVLRPL